jgi:hypothetical protein
MKQAFKKIHRLTEFIFFSNYFYGLCAVALSVEATLQQGFPLNGLLYFFLVFITTILYYSYPYIRKCSFISSNPRTNWYTRYYNLMRWNQIIITIILSIALLIFLWENGGSLRYLSATEWLLIFIFPVVAGLYYGISALKGKYNLRKIGWLKPFIIGFTWAGLVTIYPILFYRMLHHLDYDPGWVTGLLFLKNFMFITVLCIMFDIKDYAHDYVTRVRTFVVNLGLRRTIFYILLPFSVLGLGSFVSYALTHHFHPLKILLNIIPFILLLMAGWSLRRRRTILYYLVMIDGLMLAKAVCGTMAMLYT